MPYICQLRENLSVRAYPTFTPDLIALTDWLQACLIGTVAMESTGVYEQFRAREVKNLQRKAAQLGFSLTPQAA